MIVGKEIKIVKLNKNQAEEIIEDELIILNEDDEQILVLNKTATIIWSMLTDSEVDFYELCENFRNSFKDKPENDEVRRDVEEVLERLFAANLIEVFYDGIPLTEIRLRELKMRR